MIKRFLPLFFLIPVLFAGLWSTSFAQEYETFPVLDYDFRHLDADLHFSPTERSLEGIATYTVAARNNEAGQLRLHASGLAVDSVQVNGQTAEHESEDGFLLVDIPENLINSGREFTLEISYSTASSQVFLKTAAGTVFTSLMPGRRAEWIPVFEHPRVEMTTRIGLTVPSRKEVVANGYFDSEQQIDEDRKKVVWSSGETIPSTDLAFFVGQLDYAETMMGIKSVRVYSEANTISSSTRNELMREATSAVSRLQRNLRFEFPYESFSVIVLQDHVWEPKTYAATIGLLSMNAYSLSAQLERVTAAQWFGAFHRSETVADAGTQILMQAAALSGMSRPEGDLTVYDFPATEYFTDFDHLSQNSWLKWRDAFTELPELHRNAITSEMQQLFRMNGSVFSWEQYMLHWYENTGRPLDPVSITGDDENGEERERKLVNIAFEPDSERSGVLVIVEPREELERDSLYIPLRLISRSGERQEELTVHRTGGEFFVETEQRLQNITVDYSQVEGIEFFEIKNLEMWLHQLRNDSSDSNRRRAAQMMPRFRDDPDIQLAMQDFLRREERSSVRTAIVRSLSDIVEGASGTQQIFIEMARTAQGEELHAAVDAMWHYEGNEDVISAVGRVAQQSTYQPAAVAAIGVFRRIASEDQFNELSRSLLLGSRPAGIRAAAIEELYRAEDQDVALFTSLDVLESTDFPFAMRDTAMRMLIRHNHTAELAELLPALVSDADPRIRYRALSHLDRLPANRMNDLLEQRYDNERDPRVRSAFDEFY
ncbi:MAG: HEAT repeat domain-containing protein [Balneolia bacterium]|nr:HEAT repeat domain-containing protein [Balneolia bacterium]